MNLKLITESAIEIVRQTGKFIIKESSKFNEESVEIKSFNQLVSYVDKTAEEMLVKGLQGILPDAGFITEEQTIATTEREWMWVIDPLDGTTNFVHGVPVFSISVGLLKNGIPVSGVVFELNRNEMFSAFENGGAFMNGEKIQVSKKQKLEDCLLATGFPYYDYTIMVQYLNVLHELMKGTRGMRRLGSAAVDLAYVACGRFDGFFEYGLNAWDVTGGALIVKEAGGVVTDFKGGDDFLFGKAIIASTPEILNEFSSIIQKNFG